ncbi:hypothetical protein ACLKMH_10090 [Psychromonas sp. KJ10-10]|uniref:hypothetical protein n=1 Tax=Psychromonas sp. KJ10-10 TaxID=3391823 RepID=UPI0039B49D19
MKKLLSLFLFIILPISSAFSAEPPQVVVSIKPIHSLVSAVMEGVATPDLIIKKGSPHGYSLRPSEAKGLAKADLVVWVGHELESFLEKPLNTLAKDAQTLTLSEVLKSSLLTKREGGDWAKHNHDHHDHDAHEGHEEHEHDAHEGHEEHEHDAHEGHEEHERDAHEGHEEHEHDAHEGHEEHDHDAHEGHEEHDHDAHEGHEGHEGHEEHDHDAHEELRRA